MSTRRRVGFSTSSSDASRRQLMQPVPCWEKVWVTPVSAAPGSALKIYKWVRTDRKQQFSDDEGEAEPLAPLPDPDADEGEGDEELEGDDAEVATPAPPETATATASRDVSEPLNFDGKDGELKPGTPKPHPLSISFQAPSDSPTPLPSQDVSMDDTLDASLQPPGGVLDAVGLDMEQIGPDGEPFDGVRDLSQLQPGDELLGGTLMDQDLNDPFAGADA
ncbi:hypothetical protein WOLCODRAFT_140645 [Wolfiporia cocos MD-104 SS10]|uniref:Uncharacterized protein n=1 Tax=Wolfiporia cocos (strain MD-104) TaxID=742152 RepID=A0A2H3J3V0_WOLCO|nr:hypothetical protein WOLCODRAFT_140645 [Wolfiporia cocos MD-104 SS10]